MTVSPTATAIGCIYSSTDPSRPSCAAPPAPPLSLSRASARAIFRVADRLLPCRAKPAPDPAEMFQFFRIINEQADQMRGLISDLLDAGHIEAGTLSVTPEPADVADLVEQARKTFLSGGGRHTVQIDLPPDLPRVRPDRRRLVQVLNNLLANAATYSPAACPTRVAAVRDGVHVAVSVSDEGQGVPADRLPQLFRKFSRIDGEARGRGIEGSGLGLAICKGLVEAHGGRIWVESDGADRGTPG